LREVSRINQLQDTILREIVFAAPQVEYTPSLPVYDIREYSAEQEKGVYVVGGLVGEIIMTFSSLYDYVLANPSNNMFRFGDEAIETFITELLNDGFPEGAISLRLKEDLTKNVKENDDVTEYGRQMSNWLIDSNMHSSYGLRFLLKLKRDLLISDDAIVEVFAAIAKIVFRKPIEIADLPEAEEGQTEEDAAEKRDVIMAKNEEILKANEALAKTQAHVRLEMPEAGEETAVNYEEWEEKCLIKVANFKEATAADLE